MLALRLTQHLVTRQIAGQNHVGQYQPNRIEIVESSGGGLLFETSEQLGIALTQLAGNSDLRARLGRDGREALVARWTESAVLPQYFDLIRRVARRRGDERVLDALSSSVSSPTEQRGDPSP